MSTNLIASLLGLLSQYCNDTPHTVQVEWQCSVREASIRTSVSEQLLDSSDWLYKEPLKNKYKNMTAKMRREKRITQQGTSRHSGVCMSCFDSTQHAYDITVSCYSEGQIMEAQ